MLADLRLPGALEAVDEILADVDRGSLHASQAIERLLTAQITLRNNHRLRTAMRSSRLPAIKTLQQFDFTFQPSIRHEQVESLHELAFIKRKENVIFLALRGSVRPIWRSAWRSRPRSRAGASTTARSSASSSRSRQPVPPDSSPDGCAS